MSIETMGNYIIEAHKMSDKKLLNELEKQEIRMQKYEDKYGILGNPYKNKLWDLSMVARDRKLS